jgi:hypothetical protein
MLGLTGEPRTIRLPTTSFARKYLATQRSMHTPSPLLSVPSMNLFGMHLV